MWVLYKNDLPTINHAEAANKALSSVAVLGRSKGAIAPLDFGFAPPPPVWRATKICVMIVGLMK